MKQALATLLVTATAVGVAGCRRAPAARPAPDPPAAGYSRGFGAGTPGAAAAPARKPGAAAQAHSMLPPAWAGRPQTEGTVAVYVDGGAQPRATVPASTLAQPRTLAAVIGNVGRVRSALVHGDSGDQWIAADVLDGMQLRLNRRGQIKLETAAAAAPRGAGKRPGALPAHAGRSNEVRDVSWIEVRTVASPPVPGEPR